MPAKSKQARSRTARRQPTTSRVWARGKWWFIGGGIAGAIALLLVLTSALSGPETTGGEVPAVSSGAGSSVSVASADVPNFPLILYQGDGIVGSSQPQFHELLGQKPVVLNYWASNCPPCRAEMPEFEKVWRKYKDQVLFVGLDVGRFFPGFGDQDQSKKELGELGVTYVAGTPPSVDVVRELQVQGLPSTVFITPDGRVHKKWVGILNESKLTQIIEDLLSRSNGSGTTPDIGKAVPTLEPSHGPPYSYNTRPPTSGPHTQTAAAYGWHDQPLSAEAAVHNMEHGAIVIWFQPDDPELESQVKSLVNELGSECLVAGPYSDMEYDVAATAWGRLLGLDVFDADAIRAFVSGYQGEGPEAGVCFQEG